jgi:hypothetical protein
MGVVDPLKSIKEGGVGREMIDYISERFLYSGRNGGKCPATVSIIGVWIYIYIYICIYIVIYMYTYRYTTASIIGQRLS